MYISLHASLKYWTYAQILNLKNFYLWKNFIFSYEIDNESILGFPIVLDEISIFAIETLQFFKTCWINKFWMMFNSHKMSFIKNAAQYEINVSIISKTLKLPEQCIVVLYIHVGGRKRVHIIHQKFGFICAKSFIKFPIWIRTHNVYISHCKNVKWFI